MATQTNPFLSWLIAIGLGLATSGSTPPVKSPLKPIAVVELFTSQGCSSCPSADRLLTETLAGAAKTGQTVIGLSFHVDYWDRMGWKDPYSDHAFTKRQYAYSDHFGLKGVYTPQAVVNGRQEFVGSNKAKQSGFLQTALHQPATTEIRLTASAPSASSRTVTYHLDGDLNEAVLNVALVSKTTETMVQRGENAGRTLLHTNVVRLFQTVSASPSGSITLTFPPHFDPKTGTIIAYVQSKQTLDVRGATQLDL